MSARGALAALALAAVGAALALAAAAKPAPADPVLGPWAFKTASYGPGCVLEGRMEVRPGPAPGQYVCAFDAVETCRAWVARAKETCTAARSANGLSISSTVVSYDGVSYQADHFVLDTLGPDDMRGTMRSVYSAPVAFSRRAALTS